MNFSLDPGSPGPQGDVGQPGPPGKHDFLEYYIDNKFNIYTRYSWYWSCSLWR